MKLTHPDHLDGKKSIEVKDEDADAYLASGWSEVVKTEKAAE